MTDDDPRLIAFLEHAILECKRLNYNPTRFQVMLKQHGAVEALRRLVDATEPSEGFKALWEKGRPDLTAEAVALLPEFQHHFTKAQRDRARERLAGTSCALPDV